MTDENDGIDEPGGPGKALGDMEGAGPDVAEKSEEPKAAHDGNVHHLPTNGKNAADRAEEDEEEQIELFPEGVIDADPRITLKNLIKAGFKDKVEMEVSLMTAAVPLRGGIPDPEEIHRMVVSTELAPITLIPQRKGKTGDRKLDGWKIRVNLRPTYVEPADTDGLLERMLEGFVAGEPGDALSGAAASILKYLEEKKAAA